MTVFVFGSINTDIIAKVRRIPMPGETIIAQTSLTKPGGKGANQAVAAARSGSNVQMIGKLGNDLFADSALENLRANSIDITTVGRSDKPSGIALINVDLKAENCIVVVSGANEDVKADQFDVAAVKPGDVLLLQMEVPLDENIKLLKKISGKIKTKILNVAPFGKLPEEIYDYLDYVIVNEHEAVGIAKSLNLDYNLLPAKLAANIAQKIPSAIIVTNGPEGCFLARKDHIWHAPALSVQPVDTTGAGDTFCGIFASALAQSYSELDAIRLASIGASLACLVEGAQDGMPSLEKIEAESKKSAQSKNPITKLAV